MIDVSISRYTDKSDESGVAGSRLGDSQLKQLELISQLLASAQRVHLMQAEMKTDALETIAEKVVEACLTRPEDTIQQQPVVDELPAAAASVVLRSPFWKYVLMPLASCLPNSSTGLLEGIDQAARHGEILGEMGDQAREGTTTSTISARALLQILSVCSSLFPAGACWTSRSQSCWYELPLSRDDDFIDSGAVLPIRYVQGSTPEDLAIVVSTVGRILESHGDMNGDSDVQLWGCRVLEYLACSTSSLALVCSTSLELVESAWRKVWVVLFRQDLRYFSYTKDCYPLSHGEAVASVVSAIVRNLCTDLSVRWSDEVQLRHNTFLHENQQKIWELPLFGRPSQVGSEVAFHLIVSVAHTVGLSEGNDSIGKGEDATDFLHHHRVDNRGRRFRLLNFCLSVAARQRKNLAGFSLACLAPLAHGSSTAWHDILFRSVAPFRHTNSAWVVPETAPDLDTEWKRIPLTNTESQLNFPSTLASLILNKILARRDENQQSCDLLGDAMAKDILNTAYDAIQHISKASFATDSLSYDQLLFTMGTLTVTLALLKGSLQKLAPERYSALADSAASVMSEAAHLLRSPSPPPTNTIQTLRGVVDRLTAFEVDTETKFPGEVASAGDELYNAIVDILEEYPSTSLVSPRSVSESVVNFDSDDEPGAVEPSKRRREGMQSTSTPKRRRHTSTDGSNLAPADVYVCADIALALRPTARTLETVVQALVGVVADPPRDSIEEEADPSAGVFVLRLLFLRVLNQESAVAIGLRILKIIKQSGVTGSCLSIFTYNACLRFIQHMKNSLRDASTEKQAASEMLSFWTDIEAVERKQLAMRSSTRAASVRAASAAFLSGGPHLRTQWDKAFPKIVLPGTCDSSGMVRRQAARSTSLALTIMGSEISVINSAMRNIFAFSGKPDSYRKWYTSFAPETDVSSAQMWEDLSQSVACSSILTTALIGARTSLPIEQSKAVFSLVDTARRFPAMESACFIMLEALARSAGFVGVEALLLECCNDIIWIWRANGEEYFNSIIDSIPLLMTAPAAVRFMLQGGLRSKFGDCEMESLRSEAASRFTNFSQSMFPILLSNAQSPLRTDDGLKDYLSSYEKDGVSDEDVLATLVSHFLPGIVALSVRLKWESDEDLPKARALEKHMRDILQPDKLEVGVKRCASLIFLEIFRTLGSPFAAGKVANSTITKDILRFSKEFGPISSVDPFHNVGTSLTELLLFASAKLTRCLGTCRAQGTARIFGVVASVLLSCIQTNTLRNPPLSFYVQTVSNLVNLGFSSPVTQDLLFGVQEVIAAKTTLEDNNVDPTAASATMMELNVLVVSVISLHERCQKQLVHALRENSKNLQHSLLAVDLGGCDSTDEMDYGSSDKGSSSEVSLSRKLLSHDESAKFSGLCATLEVAHDFVKWVYDSNTILHDFAAVSLTSGLSSEDSVLLGKINERYCLQTLLSKTKPFTSRRTTEQMICSIRQLSGATVPGYLKWSPNQTHLLSPLERLLESELRVLARQLSPTNVLPRSKMMPTVKLLAKLCEAFPSEIRQSSMMCLGKLRPQGRLDALGIDYSEKTASTFNSERPLLSLEADCLHALARCLYSENHRTAFIACETLKTILKHKTKADYAGSVDEAIVAFLEPMFSNKGKQNSKRLCLDGSATARLKRQFGKGSTWMDWCWDEGVWRSSATMAFESWVCMIVPAMLLCQRESKKTASPNEILGQSQVMAQMDPRYAAVVLPLCILQLLLDSSPLDTKSSSAIERDTWIGHPDAKMNELISRCFTALLEESIGGRNRDVRAVSLLLDTLDFLRNMTQLRFLESEYHIPNDRLKIVAPKQSSASQGSLPSVSDDTNLSPSPWKGVLYGVVLRIDGLLLAQVSLQLKRYSSARFYAEAYADNRFGGSTKNFALRRGEMSSSSRNVESRGDVSGFGPASIVNRESLMDETTTLKDTGRFLDILRECSVKAAHTEETLALESYIAELSLDLSNRTNDWFRVSAHSPLEEMRNLASETPSHDRSVSIVSCLASLGVPSILQSYVAGSSLLDGTRSLSSDISVKWFESFLEDPRLFDVDCDQGAGPSTTFDRRAQVFSANSFGFHESFLSGLSALVKEDFKTCRVRISASRWEMTDDFSAIANNEEISTEHVHAILDRTRALNTLESLVSKEGGLDGVFDSWIQEPTNLDDYERSTEGAHSSFPVTDFVREVAVRAALRRSSIGPSARSGRLSSQLRKMLWQCAVSNRINGRLDQVESLLSRMRSSGFQADILIDESVQVSILEADIQEARGKHLLSIQGLKRMVSWLGRLPNTPEQDLALAEGLLSLGKRLTEHKGETGDIILKQYFDPGIVLAKKCCDRVENSSARKVLSSGYLSQADLLIGLYQIVSTRVSSPEWAKAGRSLADREKELKECEELVLSMTASKRKQTKRKSSAPAAGKDSGRDLALYRISLSREVQNAREARRSVEDSVGIYFVRAAESIVEALSMAGPNEHGLSKYVYRLVSIWFSSNSPKTLRDLQEVFSSAVDRIPTYRFVPLANQLFSRLGTTDHFAANLQRLARRMCFDHPYHVVHMLVRLLGDGPRPRNTAVPESQTEKSQIAKDILQGLKAENSTSLLHLVDGYQILCQAYIQLASVDASKLSLDKKRRVRFSTLQGPARLDLCLGKGSRRRPFPPCILTATPLLQPGCDYTEPESIVGFEDSFTITESGLTRPKVVVCLSSKGRRYRQLVKGGDDCRGDSVMEQVFLYVNELFRFQSKLNQPVSSTICNIATYNIVPLDEKTGVSFCGVESSEAAL